MKNKQKLTAALLLAGCLCMGSCALTAEPESTGAVETTVRETAAPTGGETEAASNEETTAEAPVTTEAKKEPAAASHYRNYTVSNGFARSLMPTEKSRVIVLDGVVFVGDRDGIRKFAQDGSEETITATSAKTMATDGKTVLFTTQVSEQTTGQPEINSEIRSVGTDGSDEKTLAECTASAQPLMLYEGKLYFTDDFADRYSYQGLFVKDLTTGDTEMTADGCSAPLTFGTRFVYNRRDTHFSIYGALSEYDFASGESRAVSDDKLGYFIDCENDTVYTCISTAQGSDTDALCSYLPENGTYSRLDVDVKQVQFRAVSDGELFYRNGEANYHVPCAGGEPQMLGLDSTNRFYKTDNGLVISTDSGWYLCHGDTFERIDCIPSEMGTKLYGYYGNLVFYQLADESDHINIKTVS